MKIEDVKPEDIIILNDCTTNISYNHRCYIIKCNKEWRDEVGRLIIEIDNKNCMCNIEEILKLKIFLNENF
jgi:hypothetical protein